MRSSMTSVNDFLAQKTLAVVGVSRSGKKMGNAIYKELKKKGYNVYQVNSNAPEIEGDKCYPDLKSLPEMPGGIVLSVKPEQSIEVAKEAASVGIKHIWMQQGSESEQAIQYCTERGISEVHKECIMMFAAPVDGVHKFHRTLKKIFGGLPK